MTDQNWQLKETDPFAPDCGACPGDGSICPRTCRVAEESPPVPVIDITARLRDMQSKKYDRTWAQWVQKQTSLAADHIDAQQQRIDALERELAEASKDAERYQWLVTNVNIEYDQTEIVQLVIVEPNTSDDWRAELNRHIDFMISYGADLKVQA